MFSATLRSPTQALRSGSSGRLRTLEARGSRSRVGRVGLADHAHRAGDARPLADERLDQLALAVARDAGDAEDLAARAPPGSGRAPRARRGRPSRRRPATCERDRRRRIGRARARPRGLRRRLRGRACVAARRSSPAPARPASSSATAAPCTLAAAAQHRHLVGIGHHLAELVRDHQHRALAALRDRRARRPSTSSASCGVSTEVGSSRISRRGFR